MADLCQTDYARVRPDRYFPETFREGECAACEELALVARVTAREALNARHAAEMELPLAPENPAKLTGPELGARVRYVNTGRRHGQVGTVIARSYVWAPDKIVTAQDGSKHRGMRRYEDTVVRFDDGGSLCILDRDLEVVSYRRISDEVEAQLARTCAIDGCRQQRYVNWSTCHEHEDRGSRVFDR